LVELFYFCKMERLIQEDYLDDNWKMLVCCILLNQTTNQQVRKVLPDLFSLISNPEAAIEISPYLIQSVIRSTGFSKIKTERIVAMSRKWLEGFKEVQELPGIGRYASDSWKIFVEKNYTLEVTDKKLKLYLEEHNS
jgi:endonuclease III